MRVSVSVSVWAWEQNSNAKDLLGRGEVIAFQHTGLNLIFILRFFSPNWCSSDQIAGRNIFAGVMAPAS